MRSTPKILLSVLAFGMTTALAVPPVPQPDTDIPKNRYISMSIPDIGGASVALRVIPNLALSSDHQFPPAP